MRVLNRKDLMNILYGCAILGTGGGGTMEEGVELIDEALAAGKEFRLASFDELEPAAASPPCSTPPTTSTACPCAP